jgi:hypothetical protein
MRGVRIGEDPWDGADDDYKLFKEYLMKILHNKDIFSLWDTKV